MTPKLEKGQSLVELAIMLPVLILIAVVIVEGGWYLRAVMNLVDANREAARFAVDLDPANYDPRINHNSAHYQYDPDCGATTDFYAAVACYAAENVYYFNPDNNYDDVVVVAWTVQGGQVLYRWPTALDVSAQSFSLTGNQSSRITDEHLSSIADDTPCMGFVSVEIFRLHKQLVGLPFLTLFVPEYIQTYNRTIWPNATAGSLCG